MALASIIEMPLEKSRSGEVSPRKIGAGRTGLLANLPMNGSKTAALHRNGIEMSYTPPPPHPEYRQYYQQQPQRTNTNVLAIISFISAFFISLLAVILGHVALSQIKRTGERGSGFAIAGLVLGYLGLVSWTLFFIAYAAVLGSVSSESNYQPSPLISATPQATTSLGSMQGKSLKTAEAAATEKGLKYNVTSPDGSPISDPEKWDVTSQVPAAGTPIAEGSTITFSVKQNAEAQKVEVPDVTGQSGDYAKEQLKQAGLKIDWNKKVGNPENWEVTRTSPAAGKKVKAGTTVQVYVKRTATPGGITDAIAEQTCDYFGQIDYPYGWKAHWILGKLASEVEGDRYYVKAEVTITNAFNAERDYNVECFVGGTADSPVLKEMNVY